MTMRRSRSARRAHPAANQRPARLAALLVVVCGVLAYANSIHGPFIFDDRRAVLENPTIRELWPISAVLHPPRQTPVAGRPISNLSFAINYAAGGLDVAGYHIWNIGVHILAALALLGIVRMTESGPHQMPIGRRPIDWRSSALSCGYYPLNSEAVNYLTQRTESMVGLFYLLTMYAAITAHRAPRPRRWALAAIVFNFCGIATKESMVTAPLMVLLWDRVFVYGSFRHAFGERRRFYFALAAGWILFGILSLETPFFSDTAFRTRVSPWTYLLNQAPIIVWAPSAERLAQRARLGLRVTSATDDRRRVAERIASTGAGRGDRHRAGPCSKTRILGCMVLHHAGAGIERPADPHGSGCRTPHAAADRGHHGRGSRCVVAASLGAGGGGAQGWRAESGGDRRPAVSWSCGCRALQPWRGDVATQLGVSERRFHLEHSTRAASARSCAYESGCRTESGRAIRSSPYAFETCGVRGPGCPVSARVSADRAR